VAVPRGMSMCEGTSLMLAVLLLWVLRTQALRGKLLRALMHTRLVGLRVHGTCC